MSERKSRGRRTILIVACLAVTVVVVGWLIYARTHVVPQPTLPEVVPQPTLPEADDIESIAAELPDSSYAREVKKYHIPTEHVSTILKALTPVVRDDDPSSAKWPREPIGRLTISQKSGVIVTVVFFGAGVQWLHYSIDGTLCRRGGRRSPSHVDELGDEKFGDESAILCGLIAELARDKEDRDRRGRFAELLEYLRRTKGELPPLPPRQR